jgi:hypothetical protein
MDQQWAFVKMAMNLKFHIRQGICLVMKLSDFQDQNIAQRELVSALKVLENV